MAATGSGTLGMEPVWDDMDRYVTQWRLLRSEEMRFRIGSQTVELTNGRTLGQLFMASQIRCCHPALLLGRSSSVMVMLILGIGRWASRAPP